MDKETKVEINNLLKDKSILKNIAEKLGSLTSPIIFIENIMKSYNLNEQNALLLYRKANEYLIKTRKMLKERTTINKKNLLNYLYSSKKMFEHRIERKDLIKESKTSISVIMDLIAHIENNAFEDEYIETLH